MLIVFFTTDLLFPSRVGGVARRHGVAMEIVTSAESLFTKIDDDHERPLVVLLDLNCSVVDAAQIVPRLKSLSHPPAIIAFGPHVHEAKLGAARDTGCDLVLTRGQFDAQMEAILTRYLSETSN